MTSATRHLLQEGLSWGAAALGVLALVYFFDDIRSFFGSHGDSVPSISELVETGEVKQSSFGGEVRLKANPQGHFVFDAAVNDRPLTFMADTGATIVALTYEDALRAGISPHSLDFSARVQTANGVARVAPVMLDRVRVEDITVRNVRAAVAEKGALSTNLLGMSFLGRLKSFQIQDGELVLAQ